MMFKLKGQRSRNVMKDFVIDLGHSSELDKIYQPAPKMAKIPRLEMPDIFASKSSDEATTHTSSHKDALSSTAVAEAEEDESNTDGDSMQFAPTTISLGDNNVPVQMDPRIVEVLQTPNLDQAAQIARKHNIPFLSEDATTVTVLLDDETDSVDILNVVQDDDRN